MSVAVGDGSDNLVRSRMIGIGHAEHLAPLVAEVLEERGIGPDDIGRVLATVGPGSFMGTRVGLSFAAGFALTRRIPTVPVTTLKALWLSGPSAAHGAVLIDARRAQVYGQVFAEEPSEPFLLGIDEARERIADVVSTGGTLVGNGVSHVLPDAVAEGPMTPDLGALLGAADGLAEGPLRPLYLRPPDAAPMARRR